MVWQYNVYALPLFFAAFMSVGLAVFMLGARRRTVGAPTFTALLLLIAEWSLADGLEYMSADLPSVLLWDKVCYVGLVSAPVACLIFVLYYTGRSGWLRARTISLLFIIPAVTLLLRCTDVVPLIYGSYGLATRYGLSVLQWTWGVWFYVFAAYSYALAVFGIALLAQQFSGSRGAARRQSLVLMLSFMVPIAAAAIMVLNVAVYPVDWGSLAFTFTGFGLFWVVFRFRLFELMPVAREAVFQEMSDGVLVLDESNRIAAINPACERMFYCEATKVLGKEAADFFQSHKLDEAYLTEASSDIALTVGGAQRYFNLSFSPLRDESGAHIGQIGVMRDITERKRMENRLSSLHEHALRLASARRMDDILKHTLDAMEFALGFSLAQFTLLEGTRLTVKGIRGTPTRVHELPLNGPGIMARAAKTRSTVRVPDTRNEEAYVDFNGGSGRAAAHDTLSELAVPVIAENVAVGVLNVEDASLNAFTAADAKVLETLASHVASAITRLRHEDELKLYSEHLEELVQDRTEEVQESERKYRQLIETAQEGLFTYDTNGVVTFINPFMSTMLGYAPEEMVGKSLLLFVDEPDATRVEAGMERRSRGIADTYEVRLIRRDESRIYVTATASPVTGKDGEYAGGLVLMTDISERREMEQRLKQAEHLAGIGETAAMVGHDLRNPLQGIAGAIYLLRDESLPPEGRGEMLKLIEDCVEYSDGIVKDLLDYARPFEPARVETTPREIAANALRALQVPSRIKVVDLSQEQPRISVDPERMKRAFVNLVENAVDAMPKGGTLTVSSKESNGLVELAVSDTGIGMSKEASENLWKPLQTTKAKGMGMGLAIVKRIVDAHNGTISVESRTGEGTIFTIRLPIKPEPLNHL